MRPGAEKCRAFLFQRNLSETFTKIRPFSYLTLLTILA
jgi:hypothetical protein